MSCHNFLRFLHSECVAIVALVDEVGESCQITTIELDSVNLEMMDQISQYSELQGFR
jgi:hypothetical protein